MTDLDAILATVLDRPEDDVPRLVYADALEDTGEPANVARAEFIRVQIELARMPGPCEKCGNDSTEYAKFTARCRGLRCSLRRREYESSKRYIVWDWLGSIGNGLAGMVNSGGWKRGFVHTVRGTLAELRPGPCRLCPGLTEFSCPRCHGTGRTGGVLREIVRGNPVERVEAVGALDHIRDHARGNEPAGIPTWAVYSPACDPNSENASPRVWVCSRPEAEKVFSNWLIFEAREPGGIWPPVKYSGSVPA